MMDLVQNAAITLGAGATDAPAETATVLAESEKLANSVLWTVSNIGIVFICVGMLICVWRVLKGPTLIDRAIAGDLLAIHVVAFVILATINFQSLVLFDAVLIISILGFVSTVATAQYIARRGTAT